MATNLVVRNIDEELAQALKERAALHGRSAEAEHREILRMALQCPRRRSFLEVLSMIPDVGEDSDFDRHSFDNSPDDSPEKQRQETISVDSQKPASQSPLALECEVAATGQAWVASDAQSVPDPSTLQHLANVPTKGATGLRQNHDGTPESQEQCLPDQSK